MTASNQSNVPIKTSRTRHLRRRSQNGLTRGSVPGSATDPGVPRLKHTASYLQERALTLAPTATGMAFTVVNATDIFTITGHLYENGEGPFLASNAGGALPAGMSTTQQYWIEVIDANTVYLHTSQAEALIGAAATRLDVSDNGTGTHTATPDGTAQGLNELLRQGVAFEVLRDATDLDALIG